MNRQFELLKYVCVMTLTTLIFSLFWNGWGAFGEAPVTREVVMIKNISPQENVVFPLPFGIPRSLDPFFVWIFFAILCKLKQYAEEETVRKLGRKNVVDTLIRGLTAGLTAGLVIGLISKLVLGLTFELVLGLTGGLISGLVGGLVGGLGFTLTYSWVIGIAFGMPIGLTTFVITSLPFLLFLLGERMWRMASRGMRTIYTTVSNELSETKTHP